MINVKKIVILLIPLLPLICMMPAVTATVGSVSGSGPDKCFVSADNGKAAEEPVIDAAEAIAMEVKSGRVLYSKNATVRRAMASTTKIMTAIVALENGKLDDIVTVSKRAARTRGSSINLQEGEKLTLNELLYGLLMNSGNDAAVAIAEHIGGSVEGFVDMMNKKAVALGAADTSFVTPHGLDAPGHYSTAYDLALITRYALGNPVFSKIVSTNIASIPGRQLYNTNELLEIYRGADGVKTGYTGKAGRCLVASATRGDMRIISVVLGSPTRYKRSQSSRAILDYAFENYRMYKLAEAGREYVKIPVYRGVKEKVSVRQADTVELPLSEDEFKRLERKAYVRNKFTAPLYAGMDAGRVEYSVNGRILAQSTLKTWETIRRKTYLDYLDGILKRWQGLMHGGIFADA